MYTILNKNITINWKGLLLWSNHFYGFCAVLLSIESTMQLQHQFPSVYLLILIHLTTVVYYTHAYLLELKMGGENERVNWYKKNHNYIRLRQFIFTCICLFIALVKLDLFFVFLHSSLFIKLIFFISGLLCIVYYVPNVKSISLRSYRTRGVLKSSAIAWVWTIACCFVPVWIGTTNKLLLDNGQFVIYFFHLFVYVLILAILFDIKDIKKDQQEAVHTIALKLGATNTVKNIVAPLLILYYFIIIYWVICMHRSPMYLIIHGSLITLTYYIAYYIIQQKAIFLNILLIDGLLLVKAIVGIIAIACFGLL